MYFDVVAVVDPVTRDAQKLAPLLLVGSNHVVNLSSAGPHPHLLSNPCLFALSIVSQVLKKLVNVNLRIFMNCQSKLSEMPLKR